MVVPLEILRCPVDRGLLRAERDSLVCEACDRHFPVVDGTPVLIDGERSLFTIDEVAESRTARDRRSILERIAYRLRPSPTDNPGAPERFRRFRDLVRASAGGPRARILVVGGGALGSGMQAIDGDPDLEFVDTDVYLNERVRVACDAHQLPFADGAFDGAIVQAVLEHVVAPQEVVAEIHRVLKPGGLVYAETPFMQAVHEGAYDFTRFTDLGHRRLFRMFEEVERGVAVGPGTSLFWAIRYFVRALPRQGGTAVRLLDFAASCATFWLVLLDRRLATHAGAYDAASGVFFLGRRAEHPIGDREIIADYRGAAAGKATVERGFRPDAG